jgi:2-polyprenyl-6-methoxyphenol hydroxylase-like FAD-dependent oxidoreductase
VLIVGGSLVGLATSMFLGLHRTPCLSIEKHRGTAIHPRAGYFQLRTLELMRIAGIEDEVVAAAHALYDPDGGVNAVETLAGRETANYIPDINSGVADISPARRLFMPQQVLEPILKDRAAALGSQFRYATELVDFRQDEAGVDALVRDIDSGREQTVRARYMVACDGNRSPVREKLGIPMRGSPVLSHSVTIYFRADCSRALRGRNLGVIYVDNPKIRGFFRLEKTGLGGFLVVFTIGDMKEPGARNAAEGMTVERAIELVREAVGEPGLEVAVKDVASWVAVCRAAESFQAGRIFLAGDAAHTMTPTGGFAGNTGIQDAHNLAWKLAAVVRGDAGPGLLDTYDQERRPAGVQAVEQAYNRYVTRSDPDLGTEGMKPAIPDTHVEFNRYRSPAVVFEPGLADDGRVDIDPRQSRARPGTRAPHVPLAGGGRTISTLDLYGHGFVLMAGPSGAAWADAAKSAAAATGVDIAVHLIGGDETPASGSDWSSPGFAEAYGLDPSGAVLVRPDGYVGWRSERWSTEAARSLPAVLEQILCRPVAPRPERRPGAEPEAAFG